MDFGDLLKMGADLIQNNSDEATTGLDTGAIGDALSGLFGGRRRVRYRLFDRERYRLGRGFGRSA